MAEGQKPERIPTWQAAIMIITAAALDLSGAGLDAVFFFAPVFGYLLSFIGWVIFYIWLLLRGISPTTGKRLATLIPGMAIEAIPLVNLLPGLTLAVVITIIMVKSEDKLGIKLPVLKK